MSEFWAFLLSPAGLVAYAGFWAFKLLAGAWVLRQTLRILPVRLRLRAEGQLARLKGLRLRRRLG